MLQLIRLPAASLPARLPARLPACSRVGKAEKTLYAGGDKQHKAYAKVSTATVRKHEPQQLQRATTGTVVSSGCGQGLSTVPCSLAWARWLAG